MLERQYNIFRVVFCFVMLAALFFVIFGIMWYPIRQDSKNDKNLKGLSASTYTKSMANSISSIKEMFNVSYQLPPEETEELNKPISEYELYNSYIDEVVDLYYPLLDGEYVRAIVYHESRYDPTARNSKTGTIGLMQINPKWHTKRALDLGVVDLYNPYGNILVGCDILNELTQQHSFDYAIDFFAGGYSYANAYLDSTSPYRFALRSIISDFQSGAIRLGGE